MSKTKEESAKAPAPPSLAKSIVGYVIGAGLGLVALFVLSALLRGAPVAQDELPHLAILVHAPGPDGFADPTARKALAKLHRDLVALGDLAVLGPNDYPVVVPGETASVRALDTLTKEELQKAAPFFGVGSYLTRIFSPDLRYAVLRAIPKSTTAFTRGTAGRVEGLLDEATGEGVVRATAYSQALQLAGDADVKATLNLYFGVQLVVVEFQPKDKGGAAKLDSILEVYKSVQAFKRPTVRAADSEGTFLHYAVAVQAGDPKLAGIPDLGEGKLLPLLMLGRAAKVPGMVYADGSRAIVQLYTEAEELQNRELGYDFRANAPQPGSGSFQFRRAK